MKRLTQTMDRTLRRHRRKIVLFVVSALLASTPNAVADEGAESQPEEPVMVQMPPPETVEMPNDYPRRLPRGRGSGPDVYVDPAGLQVPLPDASVLKALDPEALLPTVLGVVPQLDLDDLVGGLVQSLPPIDTSGLQESVLGVVDTLVGQVDAIAEEVVNTARAVSDGAAAAPANESEAAEADPAETVVFQLTTTASGVSQTFTIPLCVPTPINITSTSPIPATTIVSLCPVPLGITTAPIVPPVGQSAQLYLSINQIPGTSRPPATFMAGYTVQDPTSSAQSTIRFGLASTSQEYPTAAIVGASTDYGPVPVAAAPPQTAATSSMSWSMSSRADTVSIELVGSAKIALNSLTESNGSFSIATGNDKTAFHLVDSAAPPPSANTSIVVSAPLAAPPGKTASAALTWSNLAQEFLFNLRATQIDGRPSELAFDGSQAVQANPGFSVGFDYLLDGLLAGRFTQSGLGGQHSTSVTVSQDEGSNINGVAIKSAPGAPSTAALSSWINAGLAAFVELGAMPAEPSEVTVQLHGTVRAASAGVTVSGSNAPRFIGVSSFITRSGAVGGPQASMVFSRGATPAGLPFTVTDGAAMALTVTEVDPTFKIDIHATGVGGVVTGVDISGSTPGARTASQLRLHAVSQGFWNATLLMNQLGAQWAFKMNLHRTGSTSEGGTVYQPGGIDISDVNSTPTPNEYKELIVRYGAEVRQSLIIRRPGSDLSGATGPGGLETVTVDDPPQSFDLSLDFSGKNVAGTSCSQVLRLQGRSATASNGSITLSANLVGDPLSINVLNNFVAGDWSVGATATGPAANCIPDTIVFDMHQGIGPNPAGRLTVNSSVGTIDITSFSTTEKVTVKLLPGPTGGVVGTRIDGSNSEPNPGMAIKLIQKNGSTVQSALNIFAGPAGTVDSGVVTAVLTDTPQNFGIAIQKVTDPTTNFETLEVDSYNQAPAPAETLRITAPASLPAGGTIQFVVRSLDTASVVRLGVAPPAGQSFHARIQNQNVNPNTTQVISAALLSATGTPEYNVLFYRPSADLSGLPTSGTKASSVWERMPKSFDLDMAVTNGVGSRQLTMKLTNSQANPDGILRFSQPNFGTGLAFTGTGATQSFDASTASLPGEGSLHLTGTTPPGMGNVQISRVNDTWEDIDLRIYRSGAVTLPSTNRGSFFELVPRGEKFDLGIEVTGRDVRFVWSGSETDSRLTIAQFFQADAGYSPCIWGGSYTVCNDVYLGRMPTNMKLIASPGSEGSMAPFFDYTADDSNMWMDVNTLNSYIQFAYMPSKGFAMAGGVSTATGLTLAMSPKDPAQLLPMFYIDKWNLPLPINLATSFGYEAPANLASVTGNLAATFNFLANVQFSGGYGLESVTITSPMVDVPEAEGGGTRPTWAGLLGFEADGDPAATFSMYIGLQLNPGPQRLSWDWNAQIGLASDSDAHAFTWDNPYPYPIDRADLGLTFYTWEARPGDNRKLQGTGCGAGAAVNSSLIEWPGPNAVPFSPPFSRINNGAMICGGHVAYYQLNINDVLFKHNGFFGPYGGGDVWSYVWAGNITSDWLLAVAMKAKYGHDPSKLTTEF